RERANASFVHKALVLADVDQPYAKRVLPGRLHREPCAGRERTVDIDLLDAGIPAFPSPDIAKDVPDDVGRRRRLDREFPAPELLVAHRSSPYSMRAYYKRTYHNVNA